MKQFLILFFTVILLGQNICASGYRMILMGKGSSIVGHAKVDSVRQVTFQDSTYILIGKSDETIPVPFASVDSMIVVSDTVKVVYDGNSASIVNPYANFGLSSTISGADVSFSEDSTIFDFKDVVFQLSGQTSTGSFKIDNNKRFVLNLNGVSLQNDNGRAIVIEGGKSVSVVVGDGTSNLIADASAYVDTDSAAIWSRGQLVFSGNGTLTVTGQNKHGIFTKDYVRIDNGVYYVSSQSGDAIHAKDYFEMNGGTLISNTLGDGIDAGDSVIVNGGALLLSLSSKNTKAIKCDGDVKINGCDSLIINLSGDGCRGIKTGSTENETGTTVPGNFDMAGGVVKITLTGVKVHEVANVDTTKGAGIKVDGTINVSGGTINIYADESSSSVRGIASDQDMTFNGTASVYVANMCKTGKIWCYKSDSKIYVKDGCATGVINEANEKYLDDKGGVFSPEPTSL